MNLQSKKNSYYLNYCESIGPEDLLPGVLNFIKESHRAGLKLAVGSASRNAKIIPTQTRYFEFV